MMVQVWCQRVTTVRERLSRILLLLIGGNLVTQKSDSHMNAVCTAFSNCGSLQNPLDYTSPISSFIGTSHAQNWRKELEPFSSYLPLLLVPTQRSWKCAPTMLWGMHISNFAAQFRLASEEFMQNYTIYDPLLHGNMVLPPIGINLVKVVCECQHAYIFIFCAQQP